MLDNQVGTSLERKVRLGAVGDIAPGDFSIEGHGVGAVSRKHGANFLFDQIREEMTGYDLLLGNLEGVLSRHGSARSLRLCGLPEMAAALRDVGFEVLSVANNHVLDLGPEIFEETINACKETGINICGLKGKSEYSSEPVIVGKNGLTIGVLAYTWVGLESRRDLNKYVAVVEDGVVNYTWNRDRSKDIEARSMILSKNRNVIQDVQRLRREVDFIILLPHWGYEWTIYPPYGVILEGRRFIDVGVDLIIGSHPHVPQGVESYKRGIIVYSLGNFLFDSTGDRFRYGMVFDCTVSESGRIEHQLHFVKRGANCRPKCVDGEEQQENLRLIEESSRRITSEDAERVLADDLVYREYESQYNGLKREKVLYLLSHLFRNPCLIKPVFRKCRSLLSLMMLRLQGKKVRW
jgi:poly-gamma-glutamate synthesis protein (capsule biosynthesis protein)